MRQYFIIGLLVLLDTLGVACKLEPAPSTLTPIATSTPSQVGSITGVVKDYIEGSSIADARIQAQAPLADLDTRTDDNGRYFLSNVPPGNVTVIAQAPSYATKPQVVTVRVGETTTADFNLNNAHR